MDTLESWVKAYREAKYLDERSAAAEHIARCLWPKVHRFLRAACPPKAVEDVLMITLRAILEGLLKSDAINAVESWCFQIARNKLSNHLEGERRHKAERLTNEALWALIDASTMTRPLSAEQRMILEEALEVVDQAKPPCRDFLEKRYIYGMSFEEVGACFGLKADAARKQVSQCLKLAQRLMAEKGVTHA